MNATKKIPINLVLLLAVSIATAQENCWQEFKSASDKKGYIDKLTLDQLVLIGQKCSDEVGMECPDTVFCERNTGVLMFFFDAYKQKGGLKNLTPLFQEIENKAQTNFWRASVIECLGDDDWLELIESEQLYYVLDRMFVVMSDKTEHPRLRYEALKTAKNVLDQLESNNLLAESVIQKRLQSGGKLKTLRKDVIDGKLILSNDYNQSQEKTAKYYDKYVRALLPMLNESELKSILQRGVLRGLKTSLGQRREHTAQVRNALENAVRNYHKFDKEYWGYLGQIGYEELQLSDSNEITQKMLTELQNELEIEKDKERGIQIRNEMEPLKRLQKKLEKEKQIQSDPNNTGTK